MIAKTTSSPRTEVPHSTMRVVPDEQERLLALHQLEILDSEPDELLTSLTKLAAYICGTPISLLTLVDANRQWVLAQTGEAVREIPRESSICQYAMLVKNGILEIPDVRATPFFRDLPAVPGGPEVRFYAGAPLLSPDGQPLGALCAIHTQPHHLSPAQREALALLTREASLHMELRRANMQLEQERQKLEGLLQLANTPSQEVYIDERNEIFVKHEQRLVRVQMDKICYIEAMGDYVNIFTTTERMTVYATMKDMEAKLPTKAFTRIQRKYIVQLDYVAAIEGDSVVVKGLKGDVYIPIGNSYKPALMSRLNLI